LYAGFACESIISDNIITGYFRYGISILDASYNSNAFFRKINSSIKNNIIRNITVGISTVRGSIAVASEIVYQNLSITDNLIEMLAPYGITNEKIMGIYIDGYTPGVTIKNNTINGETAPLTRNGIYVYGNCPACVIEGNKIINILGHPTSSYYAIYCSASAYDFTDLTKTSSSQLLNNFVCYYGERDPDDLISVNATLFRQGTDIDEDGTNDVQGNKVK